MNKVTFNLKRTIDNVLIFNSSFLSQPLADISIIAWNAIINLSQLLSAKSLPKVYTKTTFLNFDTAKYVGLSQGSISTLHTGAKHPFLSKNSTLPIWGHWGHLRLLMSFEANWGQLRPFEANWGHLRPFKANWGQWGHLRPSWILDKNWFLAPVCSRGLQG